MKTLLLIGGRDSVLDVVQTHPAVSLVGCIALAGSYLERNAKAAGIPVRSYERSQKDAAIGALMDTRVDIVLSVGCPWLLPMGQLRTKHPSTLYLNVHPSCLPRLRGNHPINGALLFDEPRIGATVHWMEEDFDTGAIVAQVCIDRTPDLDLGLLYAISRLAEADALQRALDALAQVNFAPIGSPQHGEPSYYTRRAADMQCNAATCTTKELVRRVRAFGVPTQGCRITLASGDTICALDAEPITNTYLHERYCHHQPGSLLLCYDDHLLVRTCDGIVKVRTAQC